MKSSISIYRVHAEPADGNAVWNLGDEPIKDTVFLGTKEEALQFARKDWEELWGPKGIYWDVDNVLKVERAVVPTNKSAIIDILNGKRPVHIVEVVRLWDFDHKRGVRP